MQTVSVTVNASGSVSEANVEKVRKAAETFEEAIKDAGLTPTVEFASPVGSQQQQLNRKIDEDNQRRAGVPTAQQREQEQARQEQIEREKHESRKK